MRDVHRLHPLLRRRFSPTCFDMRHTLHRDEIELLLEGARWAPSAGNSQPWALIFGRRGDSIHRRLVEHLARSSASWAPAASLLAANLSHVHVEGTKWEFSEFSRYDLGQAVAHMTFQALAMGMHVHQFRAFDPEALAADFRVPAHWEITSMSAIGRPCSGASRITSRRSRARLLWSAPELV
jgi:nitroreductase